MKWPFSREKKSDVTIDEIIRRVASLSNTSAGEPITEQTALQAPTFYAAVTAISRTISMLPLDIIEVGPDGERTKNKTHNLYRVLAYRPNEWQSRYEYWSSCATSLLMHNVFYAYKNQAPNGRLMNLHPIHPSNVTAKQRSDMKLEYDVVFAGGRTETIPQEKMHRVMMLSLDSVNPVSPLNKLRESLGLEIAAEKYGASLFESGAIPNVVIQRPGSFKDQGAFDKFAASWRKAFHKKGGTAILEDGWSLEKVQQSAEESQFLETRRLQRSVIAGAMNITPHRIGDLARATFNNIESLGLEYVTYTLMPYLLAIETAISRDMIPQSQQGKVYMKFNVDALLRGDSKSRADALKIQREWGVLNANEWREIEDRNPIDPDKGGDDYLTPMNYTVAGEEPPPPPPPPQPVISDPPAEGDDDEGDE